MENCVKSIKDVLVVTIVKTFFQWLIEILGFDGIPKSVFRHTTHDIYVLFRPSSPDLASLVVLIYLQHPNEQIGTILNVVEEERNIENYVFYLWFFNLLAAEDSKLLFGGNNVIFGGKKDAPVDSSKPFHLVQITVFKHPMHHLFFLHPPLFSMNQQSDPTSDALPLHSHSMWMACTVYNGQVDGGSSSNLILILQQQIHNRAIISIWESTRLNLTIHMFS
ncbi:hypothetical protein ACJX0J_006827, partial [Zea mays]